MIDSKPQISQLRISLLFYLQGHSTHLTLQNPFQNKILIISISYKRVSPVLGQFQGNF